MLRRMLIGFLSQRMGSYNIVENGSPICWSDAGFAGFVSGRLSGFSWKTASGVLFNSFIVTPM